MSIGLIGMPRSGTTWIGKIFDSHPATLYRHEPDTGNAFKPIPFAPETKDFLHYQDLLRDFSNTLWQVRTARVAGKRPIFPKQYDRFGTRRLRELSALLAGVASRQLRDFPVLEWTSRSAYDSSTVVWKSIESASRLGVLTRTLPETKFIHILRHPCGYVASVLRGEQKQRFVNSYRASEDNGMFAALANTAQARQYGLTAETVAAFAPEERLAWNWVLINQKAMDDNSGQSNYLQLKYEDVCMQPIARSKEAFHYAGLSWNTQSEAFLQASIAQDNPAYYSVFKDPMKSATAWQRELTPEAIERVLKVLRQSTLAHLYQ